MAQINKKLIHFRTKAKFEERLAANDILETSIVFIQDEKLIWTHGTYYSESSGGNGTWATPPNTTYSVTTTSANGLMSSGDKTKINRVESYTTATTVASLNVGYQSIYVTLSANASLSASATGASYNGRSITAYVYCSSARTITIPTSGNYVSMCGSSYTCPAGKWVEFNLTCIAGVWHIAMLKME